MLDYLLSIDQQLFLFINGRHCAFCDELFYVASNRFIWIPFYAYLLWQLHQVYSPKTAYLIPVLVLLVVGTDQLANLLKFSVERFRPCHEPALAGMIHLVHNYCGGDYGFVSSHASNSMGLLVFLSFALPDMKKGLRLALIGYVLLLGYSRIYLAAHYPGDVLGGWIIGIAIGSFAGLLTQRKILDRKRTATTHQS